MSTETLRWLNTNVLVGFADKRGNAWHYKASAQGDEPNHYPGPIPVGDVHRRLFAWQAEERPLFTVEVCGIEDATTVLPSGQPARFVQVPDRKAIARNDNGSVLGIFKDGYQPHQYGQWLIDSVANILDDTLGIGSAGLLKGGAQAWVSVEVPENILTPEGVEFRPSLLACTSFDGSLSTTYKRVVTNVVCDNTLAASLSEAGQQVKVKHSRYSSLRITDARDALALVFSTADEFAAEVATLCAQTVTDAQWAKVLDALVPVPEKDGRGKTLAENKRGKIVELYNHDNRVTPWRGTAFGVLQAFNTYTHHYAAVRGVNRAERNASNAILGVTEAQDIEVVKTLAAVAS